MLGFVRRPRRGHAARLGCSSCPATALAILPTSVAIAIVTRRGRDRRVGAAAGVAGVAGAAARRHARGRGRPVGPVAGPVRRRPRRRWSSASSIVVVGAHRQHGRRRSGSGVGAGLRRPAARRPGLARPVSRLIGAPVAALPGRRRAARPRERRPQPPAHVGHRPGADDRRRPRGVHLGDQLLDPGVDRQDARRQLRRRLRRRLGARSAWSACRRRWPTTSRQIPDVSIVAPVRFAPATVDGDDDERHRHQRRCLRAARPATSSRAPTSWRPGEVVITEGKAEATVWRSPSATSVPDDHAGRRRPSCEPDAPGRATVAGIYDAPDGAAASARWCSASTTSPRRCRARPTPRCSCSSATGCRWPRPSPRSSGSWRRTSTAEGAERRRVQGRHRWPARRLPQPDRRPAGAVVIIAVLGIANTIALSVLERTRELGLLRAVGMRRRQLRATVRWEAVIISLFGTVLGLAFGLVGGWGIVRSLRDEGFGVFEVPIEPFIALAIVGAIVGVGASVLSGVAGQPDERARGHRHRVIVGGAAVIPYGRPHPSIARSSTPRTCVRGRPRSVGSPRGDCGGRRPRLAGARGRRAGVGRPRRAVPRHGARHLPRPPPRRATTPPTSTRSCGCGSSSTSTASAPPTRSAGGSPPRPATSACGCCARRGPRSSYRRRGASTVPRPRRRHRHRPARLRARPGAHDGVRPVSATGVSQLLRLLMADPGAAYDEIAAALDMPVGSIGPTRGRCLAQLRHLLG